MSIVAIVSHSVLSTRYSVLRLLRRSLRRLQRIDRGRTGKSAALSGRLLCFGNDDVTTLRPRHTAFNHQKILVLIYAQHAQVALRDARVAHVSRHAHSFKYTRRKPGRANRTRDLKHRAVRFGTTAKVMPLYNALETFSLADSHDVDKLFALKNIDQHAVAGLHSSVACAIAFERHLAHELHRRKIVLRQVSLRRLRQLRLLYELHQTNLGRFVAIF